MGLFNAKKNKVEAKSVPKKERTLAVASPKKPAVVSSSIAFDPSAIIRPRVTEKATELSKGGRTVAVFEVSGRANKRSVALAVKGLYKVTPEKVAIVPIPPKRKLVRGHMAKGTTGYKAYVYLKAGEKIEIA